MQGGGGKGKVIQKIHIPFTERESAPTSYRMPVVVCRIVAIPHMNMVIQRSLARASASSRAQIIPVKMKGMDSVLPKHNSAC